MNKPRDRGTRIDGRRFKAWLTSFAGYSRPITDHAIQMWLDQFTSGDRDCAARVLDAVHFVTLERIRTSYRTQLNALEGWHADSKKRQGNWYFIPFSRSAGESGDTMIHQFRIGAGMSSGKFDSLFIYRSDLVMKNPGPADTVVFIDDVSGTGTQACTSWRDFFSELVSGGPRVILMLFAATTDAVKRIRSETKLEPVYELILDEKDNIFDRACNYFDKAEKELILEYCKKAYPPNPKGWGDKGLVLVLAHRCPNSSIPILHSDQRNWTGLFPRQ